MLGDTDGNRSSCFGEQDRAEDEVHGIEKGKDYGMEKGKSETVLRQARLKFDFIPDARVAQVDTVGQDYFDALILAKAPGEVLANQTRQ